jgi:hypothetical protein
MDLNEDQLASLEIASFASPSAPPSIALDERALRSLSIFYYEGERANLIRPLIRSQQIQLFYHEPAYRNLLSALVTLVSADFGPSNAGTKAYIYASILAAIQRMRTTPEDIDDEAHVHCRSLVALIEQVRGRGRCNFLSIANDVTTLFESWQLEMDSNPAHVRQRRRQIMARYTGVLKSGRSHWTSILAIEESPPLSKPNFQANYFEFIASMQITSLITESYGYSMCEPMDKPALERKLIAWYVTFGAATARPELLDMKDLIQARLYLAHYIRCTILVDACVMGTETLYTRHDTDFGALLHCMERVLASDHWQSESMWLGIVCPLFFTAVHCRKPVLRQRALDLLRAHEISERSWNSRIAYLIASSVVALESGRVFRNGNIHEAAFVRLLSADFKASNDLLIVKYKDMSASDEHEEKSFRMLVVGSQDLSACRRLTVWPLVAEVRTHGAAFSRCPLGGPLDNHEATEDDYLKPLKAILMPKRIETLSD